MRDTADKLTVPDAYLMDDSIFFRHMNKRHKESLGGLLRIWDTGNEAVTESWRAFHDRLHALRIDLTHEHVDPS